MAEIVRSEAQKDIDLLNTRLKYALEGKNPDIPVLQLKVSHLKERVAKAQSQLLDAEKINDPLDLEETQKDFEHYSEQLKAAESQLRSVQT